MKYRISTTSLNTVNGRAASRGFTLVELMVTLSIAVILITMAVPSFSQFVKSNRAITQNNEFVTTLNLARSEAVRRGSRITLCPSANGTACATGGWQQGWMAFVDADGNGVPDSAATILRVHGALSPDLTLRGDAALQNFISFVSSGATRPVNGSAAQTQAGILMLCVDNKLDANARSVQIGATGRVLSGKGVGVGTSCTP